MTSPSLPDAEPQFLPRNPFARPGPIPDIRFGALYLEKPVSIIARSASSSPPSPSPSSSSGSGGSSDTLPIVVGVVVPLVIALGVFIYLHRRHVRKLRREDAEDKHKSLDFGVPQMSQAEHREPGRRPRGLSLDMALPHPYLLPPEVQHSRESLHSLSRSMNTGDDKYRATTFIPDDGSIRPASSLRSPVDDSSSFTGSSRRFQLDSKQNLLYNAQDNPRGGRDASVDSVAGNRRPLPPVNNGNLLTPTTLDMTRDSFLSTTSSNGGTRALRASNNYLGQFISGGDGSSPGAVSKKEPVATVTEIRVDFPVEEVRPPPAAMIADTQYKPFPPTPITTAHAQDGAVDAPSITVSEPADRRPRLPQLSFIDSQGLKQNSAESHTKTPSTTTLAEHTPPDSNAGPTDFHHEEHNLQEQPTDHNHQTQDDEDDYYDDYDDYGSENEREYREYQEYQEYLGYDPRRLTMGSRPLPPDDPSENPEERAIRIRSFYKEYFDETKPQPSDQNVQYYDGAEGYYDNPTPDGHYNQADYYDARGQSRAGMPGRQRATISNGSYLSGPRAYSSVSGRYGGPSPHPRPKKKLPLPEPLHYLPTPHLLKGDASLPVDFAPPNRFQNQRAGTPDSLRGGMRPYTPSIAHVPLASSFDDLAVIPSPHALRKSTLFTALDFAPPSRVLRGGETMSETGSIRSNRSGVSAIHLHNIRKGAYRVSRIPKEVAGTRDELATALRPQWNLNR